MLESAIVSNWRYFVGWVAMPRRRRLYASRLALWGRFCAASSAQYYQACWTSKVLLLASRAAQKISQITLRVDSGGHRPRETSAGRSCRGSQTARWPVVARVQSLCDNLLDTRSKCIQAAVGTIWLRLYFWACRGRTLYRAWHQQTHRALGNLPRHQRLRQRTRNERHKRAQTSL